MTLVKSFIGPVDRFVITAQGQVYSTTIFATKIMGVTSFFYNTLFRTNVRYITTIIIGGLTFEQVFNRTTAHIFRNKINEGRGFPYFEKELLLRKANADEEDDDE